MAGINDIIQKNSVSGSNEKTKQDYAEIIDVLLGQNITPVITLTLYRENEPFPGLIDELNEFLLALAEKKGLAVIRLQDELCENRSLLPAYTDDGLHLNRKTYKIWAGNIQQMLAERNMGQ